MYEVKKSQSGKYTPVGVAAGIGGFILGKYAGLALIIPAVLAAIVYGISRKVTHGRAREVVLPAFSIQAGQLLWAILGMLSLGQFGLNLVDLFVFGGLLAWLVAAPGKKSLVILTIVQIIAVAVNVFTISQTDFGTGAHKALTVHITFRAVAVVLNIIALRKLRSTVDPMEEVLPSAEVRM